MKKKALISSILTIALCFSLIAGSTFALFTSESSVNIAVTAGNVEVVATIDEASLKLYSPTAIDMTGKITDAENAAGENFANGGTATLDGGTLTLENITPGDKVSFKINIENKSNVTIVYRTSVACTDDKGLFSGLKFNIGGKDVVSKSKWVELAAGADIESLDCWVELPADAGNTYQETSCTVTFTVEAAQGNAETAVLASDIDSLRTAIADGEDVKLTDDITLKSDDCYKISETYGYCLILAKKSVNIDLNGHTVSYTRDTDAGDVASRFGIVVAGGATVNIYDSSDAQSGGITLDNDDDNDDSWGMVLYAENGSTLNVYGGNFTSSHSEIVYSQGKAPNYAAATINLYGGKYSTTSSYSTSLLNIQNGCASRIYIYGGSFKGFEPGVTNRGEAILVEGYKVVQDGDWYNVVEDTDVVVSINNKQDLYDFATAVNEGTTYEGKIVRLKADIDLNNEAWTPIGCNNGDNSKMFKGTFDGNGYTVSNLKVTGTEGVKGAGLFGYVYCGAVKNVTIKNANVVGYSHVAALVGSAMCTTIDNCHVENAVVTANTWLDGENYDDGDKVGAIVGYFSCEPTGSMTNCTVEDCEIKGYRDLGGMIGYFNAYNDQVKISGNSVKGTAVTSDKTNDYKSYSDVSAYHVGESIGFSAYTFVGTNTAANVTVTND